MHFNNIKPGRHRGASEALSSRPSAPSQFSPAGPAGSAESFQAQASAGRQRPGTKVSLSSCRNRGLGPQLARVRLARHQVLVEAVGLLDDVHGLLGAERLLAVPERVDRLPVRGLVPPEPLADARDGARVKLLNVVHVVDLRGVLVGGVDRDQLPVELAVVDHREHTKRLDGRDGAHREGGGANLDHVERVVVAERTAHVLVALDVGVLPRLGQAAVVPKDRAVVQPRLALLLVLLDRVALRLGVNLHLLEGHLRNLGEHVVEAVARLQRDVVPRRDDGAIALEGHREVGRSELTRLLKRDVHERVAAARGATSQLGDMAHAAHHRPGGDIVARGDREEGEHAGERRR
mmetsp:Transcript_18235/g.60116  ORF Transcript_18235/g.60116 Transcript_18235/m.60116 type:complete len:348 (+) Transcript_18235:19-1062(+)